MAKKIKYSQLDIDALNQKHIPYSGKIQNETRTFLNVFQKDFGASVQTGMISLFCPLADAATTMIEVTIRIHCYNIEGLGRIKLCFYRQGANFIHQSNNLQAIIEANSKFPTDKINLESDSDGRIRIHIGEATTSWGNYISVEIEKMETKYSGFDADWSQGWGAEFITSYFGITPLATPQIEKLLTDGTGVDKVTDQTINSYKTFDKTIIGSKKGSLITESTLGHATLNRPNQITGLEGAAVWGSSTTAFKFSFIRNSQGIIQIVFRVVDVGGGSTALFCDVLLSIYQKSTAITYKKVAFVSGSKWVFDMVDFYVEYDTVTERENIYIYFNRSYKQAIPLSIIGTAGDPKTVIESYTVENVNVGDIPATAVLLPPGKKDGSEFVDWTYFNAQNYATQTWINTNFIPKTHPIFPKTQADFDSWDAKGVQLTADQPTSTVHLRDSAGNIISSLNVGFLNNEGTTIFFNSTTNEIELKDDAGNVLSSFPASALVTGLGAGLNLSGSTLELTDSANNPIDSVTLTIANIQGLQSALDAKENAFSKNTAFNKNFGTTAGTVAQGNDSRLINGQTAFDWGDHSAYGYVTDSSLATALSGYMQTSHPAYNITTQSIEDWTAAFNWGNHASAGYASVSYVNGNFIPTSHPAYAVSNQKLNELSEVYTWYASITDYIVTNGNMIVDNSAYLEVDKPDTDLINVYNNEDSATVNIMDKYPNQQITIWNDNPTFDLVVEFQGGAITSVPPNYYMEIHCINTASSGLRLIAKEALAMYNLA